jgi:hypothetical protein
MPQAVRKLRRELRRSLGPETEVALFRVTDPAIISSIMALMMGAVSVASVTAATGTAIDLILRPFGPTEQSRRGWPHRVLLIAGPSEVALYASNRHGIQGGRLVQFAAGGFMADIDHYPGELELTLEAPDAKRYLVMGSWGLLRRSCSRAAHAALRLSAGSARPAVGVPDRKQQRNTESP